MKTFADPSVARLLRKRIASERRFRRMGASALALACLTLCLLLVSIASRGYQGFLRHDALLEVTFDMQAIGLTPGKDPMMLAPSMFRVLVIRALDRRFPDITDHDARRDLTALISAGAGMSLRNTLARDPALAGQTAGIWLPVSSDADLYLKGKVRRDLPEAERKFSDRQMGWIDALQAKGELRAAFNTGFFTGADSREAEQAGFLGATAGSIFMLIVCMALAFPLGVMTAVYLEEFAPKGRFADFIEVNINNLAAVPSIVFGLLGLAAYINLLGLPRSSPVVGGLTLALMILPVIIIATRAAIGSVPPSVRDAARALGASPVQVVLHHVLPLAMPGIMTGSILGVARAIGETAPLLMIGMVAFVADVPRGFTSPATAMPVQVYLWASSSEAGFVEKTAAGILVLLAILLALNALAIYIRRRFEIRW